MKVLLVNSGTDIIALSCEPVGLEYIGAFLEREGHEVKIINMATTDVEKTAHKWKPDFIGYTATTPSINSAYRSSDRLRFWGFKTIIGGIHASIFPEEAIQHCDWVVVGDGEYAMLDILNGVERGILRPEYMKDISHLPFPARHLVDSDYFHKVIGFRWPFGQKKKWATLTTARGCPYRCAFCQNSKRPIPPRYNSVDRAIEEIEFIKEEYGISNIFILDDDFFLPKPRFRELAERMRPLNINWMACARASTLTDELGYIAKESGCKFVSIGFESNSQKCLDSVNKGTTPEDNQRAADICKKYGINVLANIMIGIPGETPEDIEQTIDFVKRNKFFSTGLCIATPMPGTKLWDYSKGHGLIPENVNWDDFIIGNPRLNISANISMPREETMRYFKILDDLIEKDKARLDLGWMWSILTHYPKNALKTAWGYRKRLLKYIGRVG
jgi:radical SAM superfamily enzyme YgiQ (UPF0313 family)